MTFGQILADLREERGIPQKELASQLNISISTVSNYENGVHCPDFKMLCRLADYFDVTTDYLLGRTKYPSPLGNLNQTLAEDYTICDLINTTLSLPSRDVEALLEYVELLKLRGPSDSPR
jgi:transcriptional regulator with XRE-family HTH domain